MKFIVSLFLVVFTVTASYAANIPGFFQNPALTEKQINDAIAQWTAEKDTYRLPMGMALKALYGKNTADLTYSQVKQIVTESVTAASTNKALKNKTIFTVLLNKVCYDPAYKKFTKDLLADPELVNDNPYTYFRVISMTKSYDLLPALIDSPAIETLAKPKNFIELNPVVSKFIAWRFKYSTEVQLKCAKRLKMLVYPNIGVNDDWKALAVKLELMIKSLE
jgi:hypothetical protein